MSELGKCEFRTMKIKDLHPAEYNPRKMTEKARAGLATSIERYGLLSPIVWNEMSGRVVGGHQRLEYLLSVGEEEVEVSVVRLEEKDEIALNITLNSPEVRGKFTAEAVAQLKSIEGEIGSIFNDLELVDLHNDLVKKLKKKEKTLDDFDPDLFPPDPPRESEAVIVCPKCTSKWRMRDNKVVEDNSKGVKND